MVQRFRILSNDMNILFFTILGSWCSTSLASSSKFFSIDAVLFFVLLLHHRFKPRFSLVLFALHQNRLHFIYNLLSHLKLISFRYEIRENGVKGYKCINVTCHRCKLHRSLKKGKHILTINAVIRLFAVSESVWKSMLQKVFLFRYMLSHGTLKTRRCKTPDLDVLLIRGR